MVPLSTIRSTCTITTPPELCAAIACNMVTLVTGSNDACIKVNYQKQGCIHVGCCKGLVTKQSVLCTEIRLQQDEPTYFSFELPYDADIALSFTSL